jgi:hypothetical protein
MIESTEQINLVLEIAGMPLFFSFGPVLAIPGEGIELVPGFTTPNDVKVQKFSFKTATWLITDNEIVSGMDFTFELSRQTFTFKVDAIAHGIIGWSEIKASIKELENV